MEEGRERERERERRKRLNSLENHIHPLHRQQPAILSVHSTLAGPQGASDPLTEFTSISESSSPFQSLDFTYIHTRTCLILTRFSSSIVGRLLTSPLAHPSNTLEVWTSRLRTLAWWNGMRQRGDNGLCEEVCSINSYSENGEYKLCFIWIRKLSLFAVLSFTSSSRCVFRWGKFMFKLGMNKMYYTLPSYKRMLKVIVCI